MPQFSSPTEVPMCQDGHAHYVRTQEYASTPNYPIPFTSSPMLGYFNLQSDYDLDDDDTVVVDSKVFGPASHDFAEGDFICPGFFDRAHLDGFTRRFKFSQWHYAMRREAQPVLPFLSLGPYSCLRDRDYLRAQGFTLLLAIRNRHSAQARLVSGDKAAAEIGIMADTIDVLDHQELISAFPRAVRRVNDHLAGMDDSTTTAAAPVSMTADNSDRKRKVLVFCESGNERSASVVIAYIMVMLNLSAAHATHMVQQRRFCVSIEDHLKQILAAFESILSAKRDVERAKRNALPSSMTTLTLPSPLAVGLAKKRSFQERRDDYLVMDDNDVEMNVDGEEDLNVERRPVAPFRDRGD